MAVLLARRPEGDVLGAELVVEELLEWIGDDDCAVTLLQGKAPGCQKCLLTFC